MAVHVIDEANRCLQCKKPMCQQGCPIHTPIPAMIKALKEGGLEEAGAMLFSNNPMSLVCSLVCNHERQCEGHCVLGRKGQPVHVSSIENYISDTCLERIDVQCQPKNGKKVAVIGAGPAGITIAILLTKKGYSVTIFDSRDKIGGVLQYGIPEFRLPKAILERYKKKLLSIGIRIRPNTTIGGALEIKDLFRDGYESIFIGTGVWRPKKLGIKGESLGNVHFAIDYLANPDAYDLGDRVAVIGVGNSAMDVARTVIRKGSHHVTLYARGNHSDASLHETQYAMLDGAKFEFNRNVVEINDNGPVFQQILYDEEGNVTAGNISISDMWANDASYLIEKNNPNGQMATDNILNMKKLLDQDLQMGEFNGSFYEYVTHVTTTLGTQISTNEARLKSCVSTANSVDTDRMSQSGVSLNEEGVNMMSFNKAYQALGRLMTTMDEQLDILINNVGLVGR